MRNNTALVITLALVLGTASSALAAAKKHTRAHQPAVLSAAVVNSYASVALRHGAQDAWFAQAKGNIEGF